MLAAFLALLSEPDLTGHAVHVWNALFGLLLVIPVYFTQVKGSNGVQAFLTWPDDVSVWAAASDDSPLFTGGLPCAEGHSHCTPRHSSSKRPSDAWRWNEKVDGSLAPSPQKPAAFSIAPLGPGIYTMLLLPDTTSTDEHASEPFHVTVSSEILKCSPGFLPVPAKKCDAGKAGMVQWDGTTVGTSKDCATCKRPVKLSLDQPTKVCNEAAHAVLWQPCDGFAAT